MIKLAPQGVYWTINGEGHLRGVPMVFDSTNWWRDAMKVSRDLWWLTYAESLEIVVKKYQREQRRVHDASADENLFSQAN